MPRIIQILDCDSAGHKVRMDDGEFAFLPHDAACVPCIGEEVTFDRETGRWSAVEGGLPHMNSGAESKAKGAVEPEQAPAPEAIHTPTAAELEDLFLEDANAVEACGGLSEGSQGEDSDATPPVG